MTLQECADRIAEAWQKLMEPLEKLTEELQRVFEKINEKIEEHKRLLRRPPKWYIKANSPSMVVSRCAVYHCRNNC